MALDYLSYYSEVEQFRPNSVLNFEDSKRRVQAENRPA